MSSANRLSSCCRCRAATGGFRAKEAMEVPAHLGVPLRLCLGCRDVQAWGPALQRSPLWDKGQLSGTSWNLHDEG